MVDNAGKIIGAFTYRSFAKRAFDTRKQNFDVIELEIKELTERANFIEPEVYIDTATDWGDIDYVIVGTPNEPLGILCIADVFGRLNDFAEAFVLIYEIEHEIRDLIHYVYQPEEFSAKLEELNITNTRPAVEIVSSLEEYIEENGTHVVLGKTLRYLRKSTGHRVESLEDFSFSQYSQLICSKQNWSHFGPVFDRMREIVKLDFDKINELRNTVFHFRRQITINDTDELRRFLESLRNNRDIYVKTSPSLRKMDNR